MKKLFLSGCMLGLALSLSACGGGGGGGGGDGIGGGGGSADSSTFTISGMAGDATRRSTPALTNADQTANALVSPDSGMQDILKSEDPLAYDPHYSLKVEPDGSVSLRDFIHGIITTFKPDDMRFYTKNGVDFAVMMDAPVTEPFFEGSVTQKRAVWIGKLDYASFGYWAQIQDYQGVKDGYRMDAVRITAVPFHAGKQADYSGENLNFTGVAAGIVHYAESAENGEKSVAIPLLGTADLSIASATSGTLVLTFPNFYKFTGSVNTEAYGQFIGNFTEAQKLGSNFLPVDQPATPTDSYIRGQLYGNVPGNPSEAAGSWYFEHSAQTRWFVINGVFGVKKK